MLSEGCLSYWVTLRDTVKASSFSVGRGPGCDTSYPNITSGESNQAVPREELLSDIYITLREGECRLRVL